MKILLLVKTVGMKVLTLCLLMVTGFVVFGTFFSPKVNAITQFQTNANALGFTISDEYVPVYMTGFKEIEHIKKTGSNIDHYTLIHQVFMRNTVDTTLYSGAYRVLTSPQQYKTGGFLGVGETGKDWTNRDVTTTIQLRDSTYTLLNYTPQNKASVTDGRIGIGASPSGPQISAMVNFSHSELSVNSGTNTAQRLYKTNYHFEGFWTHATNYTKGDIYSYGMIIFRKQPGTSPWLDIKHEITYYEVQWWGINNPSSFTINRSY